MQYIVNIYLDNTAQKVGGSGPNSNAYLAAHLWFKYTGQAGRVEWVPVADPVKVSKSTDTVGFTLGDVFNELSNSAVYKITFTGSAGGPQSPLDDTTTQQLANGTYPWTKGHSPIVGLKNPTDYVTTGAELPLINPGANFEFSLEVDDGGTEVYYMDPRMIVDP
jgi:hypothetical protein